MNLLLKIDEKISSSSKPYIYELCGNKYFVGNGIFKLCNDEESSLYDQLKYVVCSTSVDYTKLTDKEVVCCKDVIDLIDNSSKQIQSTQNQTVDFLRFLMKLTEDELLSFYEQILGYININNVCSGLVEEVV